MAKGYSDIGTELRHAEITGSTIPTTGFAKLVSVRSTSEKGGSPATIENTVLDEAVKSYVKDRQETPSQVYDYNHTEEDFGTVLAVCDKRHAFLEILPSGDGYLMIGDASTWHKGFGSPGSLSEATMEIVCESIEYKTKTEVTALIGS